MITDYTNFNYNKNFTYNHNIFKNNYNVGIGTFNPKNLLDIYGNVHLNNSINIHGNLNLIQHHLEGINIITYNTNTQTIKPLKLISHTSSSNTNEYNWKTNNDNLELNIRDDRDNIIYDFQSKPIIIHPNNTYYITKIYNQSKTIIDSIYIYNNNNTYENLSNIKINNIPLTYISDYKYKLNNNLVLESNSNVSININNFNNTNNYYKVHFLGYYDFINGKLWSENINDDIYIHSNISVQTNKNTHTLDVNGTFINEKNLYINKDLINNNTKINGTVLNKGITNVKSLTSKTKKMYINSNKLKLLFGTLKLNNDINIGDSVQISNLGTIETKNTNCDNITLKSNLFSNNDSFKINQQQIKLNNLNIFKPNTLNTKHNNTIIYLNNNININNYNSNNLNNYVNIKGNINTNNLHITNSFKINNLDKYLRLNNLKTNNLTSKNIKSEILYTKSLKTNLVNLQQLNIKYSSSNKIGSIYYNSLDNTYYGKRKNDIISFVKTPYNKNKNNIRIANLQYTIVNNILVNKVKSKKKLILPKTNIYKNYDNTFNKTQVGAFQYNLNSLHAEIYNGYKWGKIKYKNSDSEIKNISINYSKSSLTPEFSSRVLNYTCNYNNSVFPLDLYIVNPPLHKIIIKKDNSEILTTKINNTNHFKPINYILTNLNINNNNNIYIKSESNANSAINIEYNLKFNNI